MFSFFVSRETGKNKNSEGGISNFFFSKILTKTESREYKNRIINASRVRVRLRPCKIDLSPPVTFCY